MDPRSWRHLNKVLFVIVQVILTVAATLHKVASSLLYTQFGVHRLRCLCQQRKGLLELRSEVLPS